ncbi:RHS repeat-associated core domain-containing protein [Acholeplasma manati]|nr:RHS repeat-associated core domain-containing protein [Paracholeplasma manati]
MDWYGKELASISKYCESNYYKYNDQGIRTQKTTGTCSGSKTTKYTLSGNLVIMESWGTNVNQKIYYTYDVDGSLISFEYNNNEYFYIRNLQGDIIKIIDINGNVLVTYSYDAFGNTLNTTDTSGISLSIINPYRYRGYRYDLETGFYYLQSRYYNPQIGRFISPDSINYLNPMSNSGENLYTYTANNPVNLIDPDGNFAISAIIIGLGIAALIGAGIGAVVYTVSEIVSYTLAGEWSWSWGMFTGSIVGGALGGIFSIIPGVGPMGAAFMTGFLSSAFGMGFQNLFRETDYSFSQIFLTSLTVGVVSALTAGMMDKLAYAMKGSNTFLGNVSGRGSLNQVTRQIITKFNRGLIKNITCKTFGKMFAASLYYSSLGSVVNGVFDAYGLHDRFANIIP